MKKAMLRMLIPYLGLALFAIGCKKDDFRNPPPPHGGGNGQASNVIRFSIDSLPGERAGLNGLSALITVVNEQNQAVVSDKKINLQYSGKYMSDTLILPNGSHKLTRFLVVDDTVKRFATPVANSPKASSVQHPLSLSFQLPKASLTMLTVEVARINPGDEPESFGYPKGTWNNTGGNPPPVDPAASIRIMVKPMIRIGDVVYDSIPVNFTWITWDETGKMIATQKIPLPAGTNEVTLPGNAFKYNLQVERWGIHDEMELLKSNIQQGTVYSLGGSKAAKKLKSELVYKWVNGAYQPFSKNEYQYDAGGNLLQILYYLRKADNTPYVSQTDKFFYNAVGKVDRIKKYDSSNALILEYGFNYDQQGKITRVLQIQPNNSIDGQVTYSGTGANSYNMNIRYNYPTHPQAGMTMTYNVTYKGGNNVKDEALSSNNANESGTYQYDFNINPYIHMNWPDIYLSHTSRNNLIGQQKVYTSGFPTAVPYGFDYTYDADGYPKELIKTYFTYYSGTYMYTTKTVYNY